MSNFPPNAGFLIDESLSPELATMLASRGYRAHAVTRDQKLRGRGDAVIARYAIEHEMILVTNNAVDFERIYVRKAYHPGLILICSDKSKLRKRSIQLSMMEIALDEIERDYPLQEAIRLTARTDGSDLAVDIDRFYLPDLDRAAVA